MTRLSSIVLSACGRSWSIRGRPNLRICCCSNARAVFDHPSGNVVE